MSLSLTSRSYQRAMHEPWSPVLHYSGYVHHFGMQINACSLILDVVRAAFELLGAVAGLNQRRLRSFCSVAEHNSLFMTNLNLSASRCPRILILSTSCATRAWIGAPPPQVLDSHRKGKVGPRPNSMNPSWFRAQCSIMPVRQFRKLDNLISLLPAYSKYANIAWIYDFLR